jgi:hypothetical protein
LDLESAVFQGIKQFPTIGKKVDTKRLSDLLKEDPDSAFLNCLAKSIPDEERLKHLVKILEQNPNHLNALVGLDLLLRPYNVMKYLDTCLDAIQDARKLNAAIEHLMKSDSFWQGYSEIEVAANIKRVFGNVELEPSLGNEKKADVKFIMDSKEIFLEVTVPKRSYAYVKLIEESVRERKVVQLEAPVERAGEKILTELEHFADVLGKVHSVIVINLNETEIEDIDIEDSLMGKSKFVVLTDRSTGKVEMKEARGDWTAFSRETKLAKVGAIVCYKRDFTLNGKILYQRKVFGLSFGEPECELLLRLFPDN